MSSTTARPADGPIGRVPGTRPSRLMLGLYRAYRCCDPHAQRYERSRPSMLPSQWKRMISGHLAACGDRGQCPEGARHGPDLRVGRRPCPGSWRCRAHPLPELSQRRVLPPHPLDPAGQPVLRAGHAVSDGRVPRLPRLPPGHCRSRRLTCRPSSRCTRPRRRSAPARSRSPDTAPGSTPSGSPWGSPDPPGRPPWRPRRAAPPRGAPTQCDILGGSATRGPAGQPGSPPRRRYPDRRRVRRGEAPAIGAMNVARKHGKKELKAETSHEESTPAVHGGRVLHADDEQGLRARDAPAPRRARGDAGVGEGDRRQGLHRVRGPGHRRQGRHDQADHRAGQPARVQGRRPVRPDRARAVADVHPALPRRTSRRPARS